MDPSLPPAAAEDALPVPAVAVLPTLAAILPTGDHPRSLDAATLLRLDKRVPIYVPAGGAVGPRIAAVVRELGFADVRPVEEGQRLAIGRGGEVGVAGAPRGSGRVAYVLRQGGTAALATGAAPRDAVALEGLTAVVRAAGVVVSPVFVEVPVRARAPIKPGWAWLLERAARWLAPSPSPAAVVGALASADATLVGSGDDAGGRPWLDVSSTICTRSAPGSTAGSPRGLIRAKRVGLSSTRSRARAGRCVPGRRHRRGARWSHAVALAPWWLDRWPTTRDADATRPSRTRPYVSRRAGACVQRRRSRRPSAGNAGVGAGMLPGMDRTAQAGSFR